MASERPKLPPGCTGPHRVGDYDDGMRRVTTYAVRSGGENFAWGETPGDASRNAWRNAWARFEELFGITRERWEAMEQDSADLRKIESAFEAVGADLHEAIRMLRVENEGMRRTFVCKLCPDGPCGPACVDGNVETVASLRARAEKAEAVLHQHVQKTIEVHDAWAAEGHEARPCKCPGCRTYRAALWVLDLPDSGQKSWPDVEDDDGGS